MTDSKLMKTISFQPGVVPRWAALLVSAGIVLTVDQVTKMLVLANLALGETWEPIPAISNFFAITHSANTGAAFSLLPQLKDIFLIISLAMITGIFLFYNRMQGARWAERIALGLVLGGAAGNALDRIRLGYVVDFVHLQLRPLISNVSNLADHAIVIGILVLFIIQWRSGSAGAAKSNNSNNSTNATSQPELREPE